MPDKLAVLQTQESIKELERFNTKLNETIEQFNKLVPLVDKTNSLLTKGTPKEYLEGLKEQENLSKSMANLNKELIAIKEKQTRLLISEQKLLTEKNKTENQEIRNKQLLSREEERINKLREKEEQKLQASESLYSKIEIKLKALQNEYKMLAIKKELGVELTDKEERSINKLHSRIEKYDKALKAVDASMGKYQRNVGNYASAFNPLQNSINQLTREAPAFANSVQTGFMAISNNLPILFDSIGTIINQNKQLQAQGKSTKSVLGQVAGAFLSWNTALSVGVTLLTVYGADIWNWAKGLLFAKDSIDQVAESKKTLNESFKSSDYKNAVRDVSEMKNIFDLAKEGVISKDKALKKYNDSLGKVMGTAKNLNEAEQILTKNADNYIKATLYKAAANRALDQAAEAMMKAELARQKSVEEREKKREEEKSFSVGTAIFSDDGSGNAAANYIKIRRDNIRKEREKEKKEKDDAIRDAKKYENIAKNFLKDAANFGKGLNLDIGVKDDKPKKPKKPKASQISEEKRDAIDNITAERDRSLAELNVQKVKGEITEIAYQEARIKVIQDYAIKIQKLLNENNAKENKLSAQAQKKAADELEKSLKDIFDIRKKAVETQQTELIATNEKERNEILNNEDLSETERVTKLIENNQKKRDLISKNYEELLSLAKEFNQADFDITKDYHNQSEKAEEEHLKLLEELNSAFFKDIEIQTQREEAFVNMTYEQKKAAILQDKSLKLADKELQIKLLEYEQQKKINEEKIKGLKLTITGLENRKEKNGSFTKDEEVQYFNANAEIGKLESDNVNLDQNAIEDQAKFLVDKFAGVRDIIANGFKNLGLDGVSDQFKVMFDNTLNLANGFYKSLGDKQKAMMEIAAAGAQIALSFGSKMIEEEKNRRIAQIDEEIKHSQEQTDLELSFINQRLEAYSNMNDLTQEQMEDRNALEDEARVLKEQQEQREKMLQAQKLRAEQKAQAQQTLIDGASGAVKAIATYGPTTIGWSAAAASVAFAALQYALIMSKNPVPQYFKGRKGGKREIAWTQERGAEIITDKHGNIKTLGTNKGATLTQLEQGDTVYTAEQSKNILKNIPQPPIAGDDIFRKSALKNIVPIVHHSDPIDYDKLALKIGEQQEKIARKYDKTTTYEENGYIYKQEGARIPVIIGRAKAQNIIIKSRSNERN